MKLLLNRTIVSVCLWALAASITFAQTGEIKGETVIGERGIVVTVAEMQRLQASQPARPRGAIVKMTELRGPDRSGLPQAEGAIYASSWPRRYNDDLPSRVDTKNFFNAKFDDKIVPASPYFTIQTSFAGPDLPSTPGFFPPDTMGDVSPTQVVMAVNGRIRSYSRNGGLGGLDVTTDTFFNSVRNGQGISDPRVKWDPISQRWIVIAINVASSNNRCVIGVSNGSTITDSSSFTFYFFTPTATTRFLDYPTLGVDNNALYIGGNMFNGSYNTDAYVVRKSSVLSGGPIVVTKFANLIVGSSNGIDTPQGVDNDDPAATEGYFLGVDAFSFGKLVLRRVINPGGTPTLSSPVGITVLATTMPQTVLVPGGQSLDGLDDRLFAVKIFRDAAGNRSMWTAHNIEVDATGVANSSGNRNGSRWYKITGFQTGGTLNYQAGTVFDASATPQNYWIPSIAMNMQGHAFIGYTRANSTTVPGVGGAFRLASDIAGTMQTPQLLVAGTGNYNPGINRWGDYSLTTVDPFDGMSIWTFQELVVSTNTWGTRAVKLRAPAPTINSLSPATQQAGTTGNVVVNGTGIFDPGAGFVGRLAASVSGTGVNVNSVTWNNANQATLNITVASGATPGARTLTLTNPDGQTATATFTVQALATVQGSLTLSSFLTSNTTPRFNFELRNATTNATLETFSNVALGGGNTFSLTTNLSPGNYKLYVKGTRRFLSRVINVTLTSTGVSGLSITMTNGDVDGNNAVSASDLNQLRSAFGSTPSSSNWNEFADLNGDLAVSATDLNILRSSFGQVGE